MLFIYFNANPGNIQQNNHMYNASDQNQAAFAALNNIFTQKNNPLICVFFQQIKSLYLCKEIITR